MARQAVLELIGDASKLRKTFSDASDDADGFGKKVSGSLGRVGGALGDMAKTAAIVGIPAVVGFGVAAVKAFAESEQVAAQTAAVLKSTGGAAQVTADHIGDLAGKLSMLSGVDDDVIQSGENMLLTFTNIKNGVGKGNDVFDQATQTMLDMSVALGTDAKTSAMQLGKALNDPVKGITALRKVGVSFTAAQEDQIKALVASGHTMEAQKLILKELQTEFGGSAKAAGDTFAGKLNKLKVQFGNLMEEVGGRLVPVLSTLADWLSSNLPKAMDAVGPAFQTVKGFITSVSDAIQPVIGWIQTLVNRFHSGGDGLGEAGGRISKILTGLRDTFSSAFGAIQAIVATVVAIISDLWARFGSHLVEHLQTAINSILQVVGGVVQTLGGIFDLIKAILTGKWGDAWNALLQIFGGVWNIISGTIKAALNSISTIIGSATAVISAAWGLLWHSLGTLFSGIWDGIKAGFVGVINWIIDRWNGIKFTVPSVDVGPVHIGGQTIGVPRIPRLAKGGITNGPTLAMVGDNPGGREAIIPLDRYGKDLGAQPITITVQGNVLDGRQLGDLVADALARQRRFGGTPAFAA